MKKLILLFVILLFVPLIPVHAQILSIVENNRGKKLPISANDAQIVDINGNLEISISKKSLFERIRNDYPQFSKEVNLQSEINALAKALVDQAKLLELLKKNAMNKADKEAFYTGILTFYDSILSDPGLTAQADKLVLEYIIKYPARENIINEVSAEYYLLTNLNKNLLSAKEKLSGLKGVSFNISMVAYIKTKLSEDDRVHIRNFDTYKDRDFYSVPRWVTTLDDTQTKKLEELKVMADDYNTTAPNYFDSFKAELLQKFPEVDCIIIQKSKLQDFLNDPTIKNNLTLAVKNDINAVIAKYDKMIAILKKIKQDVSSWNIDTPFVVIAEAKNLLGIVTDMGSVFETFKNSALEISQLKEKAESLGTGFISCYNDLEKAAKAVGTAVGILKDQQIRFDSTKQLDKEVLKFGIENLPATGYIKLEGAGPRENGDKIEIDLIMRIPTKDGGDSANAGSSVTEDNEILETRIVNMQLIGLRSETVVGIILADSYNENNFEPAGDRRFLYAPAASLLLKIGSRHSKFYNDFVDFGLGVSVSTPDFNTDGTPEFGAGVMFTAFKDILSVGINYNVTLDTPYWSFGINLPFNLPGIPINTTK